jgi:tetratricopeptide (TPR) repeat protein
MATFEAIVNNEQLIIRERLDALFPLVSLTAARGDFAGAIELLERFEDGLKEERIREAMAISMKALFQLELGNEASARELANSAIALSPGPPTRYLFARGLIELATGQYKQAETTANEIISHALPPDDPDRTEDKAAAFLAGMALLEQGKLEAAREEFTKATSLGGYPYRIYELGLARVQMQAGETDIALQTIETSVAPEAADPRIDLEPDRVKAYLLSAEIHQVAGKSEAAGASAQRFLKRFDRAEPTHPMIMRAQRIAGQADLAGFPSKKGDHLAALSTVTR